MSWVQSPSPAPDIKALQARVCRAFSFGFQNQKKTRVVRGFHSRPLGAPSLKCRAPRSRIVSRPGEQWGTSPLKRNEETASWTTGCRRTPRTGMGYALAEARKEIPSHRRSERITAFPRDPLPFVLQPMEGPFVRSASCGSGRTSSRRESQNRHNGSHVNDALLLTGNLANFQRVPELRAEHWTL